MPREKIITGIDIGSNKVSTAIATVHENKVSIIGVSGAVPSKGIKRGSVVDIDSAVESISTSLERAERMAGVSVSSAFVTLNGSHIQTQNSHGVVAVSPQIGEITREDVLRVTEAAQAVSLPSSRQIVHVIPRDFIVDSQEGIKDPVGMAGVRLEVETNIVHGSATAMKNLVKCIDQVGVEVQELIYVALASSEAVLTDTEKELGTILVDIGGGTTSLIAYMEGSPVYSSVLGIGAKHITSDLAIGLRTRLDDAERIKLKLSTLATTMDSSQGHTIKEETFDVSEFGLDQDEVPIRFLREIVNARTKEIFNMVALELNKAGLLGKLPAGAVVTGGGAQTFDVQEVAKKILKMPVRIGTPTGVTGLIDEIRGPDFAGTVGAILYGVDMLRSNSLLFLDKSQGKIGKSLQSFFEKIKSFLP
ncbi:cell division protein FtsA [candidate division WWE3 bacterium]|nr:cell division protein FtsA [candidate division WWE3 bacterium]